MRELEALAPAKINLFLGVLARREDGYHELVSVMQKLTLADRLHLRLSGQGISLSCPSSDLPEDTTNLAWRAAHLFFERVGLPAKVRITLDKRIPVAAGLGGGSSDAAAVLLGLNRLHDSLLDEPELLALGARLGADVPFFVGQRPAALVTGIGTELWPIDVPTGYRVLLVNPGLAVSTAWVYANLGLTTAANPYKLRGYSYWAEHAAALLGGLGGHGRPAGLYNDLEAVTMVRYPVLRTIKEQLLTAGAVSALMSGSGATVFGLFAAAAAAEQALAAFQGQYPGVYLTEPLT